jgi:subtilase family serine protease
VDSLSVSWGLAEVFYFEAVIGQDHTGQLLAFHQAFLELAAQGVSTFAASRDHGAYGIYDGNVAFENPYSNALTVDSPGSDPAITAAGGTTTPVVLTLINPPPNTPLATTGSTKVFPATNPEPDSACSMLPKSQPQLTTTGANPEILPHSSFL